MTEVLSLPPRPDSRSEFGTPRSRTASHTNLFFQASSSYAASPAGPKRHYAHVGYDDARHPPSEPSSAPPSPFLAQPDFSNQPSYVSTPSSSISLDDQCASEVESDISFPCYDDDEDRDEGKEGQEEEEPANISRGRSQKRLLHEEPQSTPLKPVNSEIPSTGQPGNPSSKTLPCLSTVETSTAEDDIAISKEPTRHVDYLTHDWDEEDIWSSWKHVVSRRKVYSESPRLENASWRSWTKSMYRLKTVSPEKLNWFKDHDTTWLYGPLQTRNPRHFGPHNPQPTNKVSRSDSFGSKKPILKKRSLSEIMLQRSLSSATLMRRATDALRAQQPGKRLHERPILYDRALSDYNFSSSSSITPPSGSATSSSKPPSALASGRQTPCTKKHIHFNNKVEQCIAINSGQDDCGDSYCAVYDDSSSSDEELLTMKSIDNSRSNSSNRGTPQGSFSHENKTIAMLPSTTLNYRGDTPDPAEQSAKQKTSFWNQPAKLTHSSSQETIKPASTSSNFLLDDEDEEFDTNWQPSADRRAGTIPGHTSIAPPPYDPDEENRNGLRRTPSGMFMPYEEDEDDIDEGGVLGKIVDTVNTAKDIAHVIWNVGWRR